MYSWGDGRCQCKRMEQCKCATDMSQLSAQAGGSPSRWQLLSSSSVQSGSTAASARICTSSSMRSSWRVC